MNEDRDRHLNSFRGVQELKKGLTVRPTLPPGPGRGAAEGPPSQAASHPPFPFLTSIPSSLLTSLLTSHQRNWSRSHPRTGTSLRGAGPLMRTTLDPFQNSRAATWTKGWTSESSGA